MCAIYGWSSENGIDFKYAYHILKYSKARGRDGFGVWADGVEWRGLDMNIFSYTDLLAPKKRVVGNFRATPTTELQTASDTLQPYGGVVHNGTIANDKSIEQVRIDSMVLSKLFSEVNSLASFAMAVNCLVGSYATAFFRDDILYLGANYKPIYYTIHNGGLIFASQRYMLPFEMVVPFPPYSVGEFLDGKLKVIPLLREPDNKRVVIAASSGLDSTTAAYMLKSKGYDVTLCHFRYGALAGGKEEHFIRKIANHGGFGLIFIDLPKMIFSGSIVEDSFCRDGEAGAEYAHDWVSARNLVMLSLMTAWAETNKFGYIALGNNLEEAGAYPDNEEEFGNRFNAILPFATQNGVKIELLQPLSTYMKHEIVKLGLELGVPYHLTWSCYGDGRKPCNECGPCYMRRVAFERNGTVDPLLK